MLKRFVRQFNYGKKGFTLIELLVVIAILGLMAAVAIPNVTKFVHSGNVAAANTELGTVQSAAQAYATSHSSAPAPFDSTAIASYLDKPIKGSYSFDQYGHLIGTPTYPGLTWNDPTWQFK